jgi:hypothetical protein
MSAEKRRRVSPLAEAELEVLEEGREWMRQRLEKKLQRQADRQGVISPPKRPTTGGGQASADSDSDYRR